MKIFIIGEEHDKDQNEKLKLRAMARQIDSFLLGEENVLQPYKNSNVEGLQDFIISFHFNLISIYCNYFANSIADIQQEVLFAAGNFNWIYDGGTNQGSDAYYNYHYYQGVLDHMQPLCEELKNAITDPDPDPNLDPPKIIEIIKKTSAIIKKNQYIDLTEDKSTDPNYIASFQTLSPLKRKDLWNHCALHLRDKVMAHNVKKTSEQAISTSKDSATFIVGRMHLEGIRRELGEQCSGVDIIYCSTYKEFNRAYKAYKIKTFEIDHVDLVAENISSVFLTDFFKQKIRSQQTLPLNALPPPLLQVGENKITLEQKDLDLIRLIAPGCGIQ